MSRPIVTLYNVYMFDVLRLEWIEKVNIQTTTVYLKVSMVKL